MHEDEFDPASIEVFVGIDMAKRDHYAQAIGVEGKELFDRPVANDEAAIGSWSGTPLDTASSACR